MDYRQHLGAPLRRPEALRHDFVVRDHEPERHAIAAPEMIAVSANVIRPVFVIQDIVEARRFDLPVSDALEILGGKKDGAISVLPGSTRYAVVGADINQHDIGGVARCPEMLCPYGYRNRRKNDEQARAKARTEISRSAGSWSRKKIGSKHDELFLPRHRSSLTAVKDATGGQVRF